MTIRSISGCFAAVMLSCMCTISSVGEETPWPLRDHYSFAGNAVDFLVDAKRAEWRSVTNDGQEIVGLAYTEIVLGDGQRLRLGQDSWTTDGRDDFSDGFGEGMRFRSEFKPIDGLHIEHHVNRYDAQSFVTVMIIVRNTSNKPISLASIRMGVMDEGRVNLVSTNTLDIDYTLRRGTHVVPSTTNRAALAEFHAVGVSGGRFGVGLLQSGFMESSIGFDKGAKGWSGSIDSTFNPPISIAPGATAQSDALWVMFSAENSNMLRDVHGWAKGYTMPRSLPKDYPSAWITVASGATSDVLLSAAGRSSVTGLNRVLVPGGWPTHPDTMGLPELATALRRKKMVPGLTVDPLRVVSSSKGMTLKDGDGHHWIDLRSADAREYGIKQLRRIVNWKYGFFAVAHSDIPDGILSEMNISRSVADVVAFELMEAAAGILPVVPTSEVSFGNDADDWNNVARSTRANREFEVKTGPARLEVEGVESLSNEVVEALKTVPGPIEIVGNPSKKVRKQLGAIFAVSTGL